MDAMTDNIVIKRVLAGETTLFEVLMRRYNTRLYRVARAILRDDSEAEDVVQEAHVRAYTHLNQFAGQATFSTWLTKIAMHEALARIRHRSRFVEIDSIPKSDENTRSKFTTTASDPEQEVLARDLKVALEAVVNVLPKIYRLVFMLRDIAGMSTAETALCLGISEETVKTRLHRARALMSKELYARTGTAPAGAFQFAGSRCDRVVSAVFDRIRPFEKGRLGCSFEADGLVGLDVGFSEKETF